MMTTADVKHKAVHKLEVQHRQPSKHLQCLTRTTPISVMSSLGISKLAFSLKVEGTCPGEGNNGGK